MIIWLFLSVGGPLCGVLLIALRFGVCIIGPLIELEDILHIWLHAKCLDYAGRLAIKANNIHCDPWSIQA